MIMTYQGYSADRGLNPMENNMLNVGGYLTPPLPMYQYQQPYNPYYNSLGGMGSYYNQNSYGYYNPYEQKMKYEQMQQEYEERSNCQKQSDLSLIKMGLSCSLGREATNEEVMQRYNELTGNIPINEIDRENLEQFQLLENYQRTIHAEPQPIINPNDQGIIVGYNELTDKYSDCEDLFDYCNRAEENMYEDLHRKAKEERWNLSSSYNSSDFSSLLDIHNSSNIFSYTDGLGNRKEADISDQLITLPPNIASEYEKRKARFIAEMIDGGI